MKPIVLYSSKTGNTKQVAEAIANAYTTKVYDIAELDLAVIEEAEQLIVGGWVDKGHADDKTLAMLSKIHNKQVGVFLTLGAYPDSEHAEHALEGFAKQVSDQGNTVVARFICQGKIDPKITAAFMKMGDASPHKMDEARIARHKAAASHPDQADFDHAIEAFKSMFA